MKILIFSDLHVHNYQQMSRTLPNGMNSRLADCIGIVDQAAEVAANKGCNHCIFCGDWFHSRTKLDIDVLYYSLAAVKRLSSIVQIVMIPGNHDCFGTSSEVTSLDLFRQYATVIDKPCTIDYIEAGSDFFTSLTFVPWQSNPREFFKTFEDSGEALFMHQAIDEGVIGPTDRKVDVHLSVNDLPLDRYKMIFAGDYHKHQTLANGKFVYCGSPLQLTFGERDEPKGILVYDTDTGTMEFVPTKAPKFHVFDSIREYKAADNQIRREDFVRVKYTDDEKDDPIIKQEEFTTQFEYVAAEKQVARGNPNIVSDDHALLREYLDTMPGIDAKDKPELLELGMEMLSRVA